MRRSGILSLLLLFVHVAGAAAGGVVTVSPKSATLRRGDAIQIRVIERSAQGNTDLDRTSRASFESDDPLVADVGAVGLVTAERNGRTRITVTYLEERFVIPVAVMDFIDLGEIVGGGDGTPHAPPFHLGINADTGRFEDRFSTTIVSGTPPNPHPVDTEDLGYDFIDSVFLMTQHLCQINLEGERFLFPTEDEWPNTWDLILNASEPGSSVVGRMELGAAGHVVRGIGLHASAGITFDLDALRDYHGDDAVRFVSAHAGEGETDPCYNPPEIAELVNCHVILTDGEGTILASESTGHIKNDAKFLEFEIPAQARFLTFAVGSAGNTLACDHGVFGNAFIARSRIDGSGGGGGGFIRGDADASGVLEIADAIDILLLLFADGSVPCVSAADTDDNGRLDMADPIRVLGCLYLGTEAPAPPFEACGTDPTPDAFSCEAFPACDDPK
ncbi:MAG: Ig-like domain-containing protein [Planctomycetes bacterium]|nr:Ig-like domain-containing protein [Planctomycetota bacterium]